MATEVAEPLATHQEASMEDRSPQDDLPPVPSKETDSGSSPAEDRLSSSESPEPAGESRTAAEGAGKGAGGTNGSAAAAPAAPESKSEQEGKAAAAKTKKKEDKSIEYILRALSSLNSPEEKLAALCKKYADLHEEHRVLQTSFKSQQRKMTVVQREKDQLQAEHTKAVIAKSKLESLCRELQKQNKVVKEESILRQKEEEEKRKEISAKFQTTIGEIQTQMTENHEKNVKLREENHDLASKLKKFLEQQELREQQLDKLTKHRELESQLAETKLAHAAAIMKEQEEKHHKEKELLLLQTAESQKKNAMLEAQLNMYKDRYEEFQGTINKSNDMFQKLKSEMDKMGKRIKKLEKEGAQWRAKWEASNKALLDMAEEKTRSDKEKQLLQTKIIKLESLCRALQGEMHGKKSASPQPSSATDTAQTTTTTTTTAPAEGAAPASTTATPPNTPEENTSRASPNPESPASLPSALPTGQNGPIPASLSAPEAESGSGSEAVGEEEEEGEESSATTATEGDEEETSSKPPPVPVEAVTTTTTTTTQLSETSSSSAPSSDQQQQPSAPVVPSNEDEAV
ncbi:beta-taxilin-like isoform X2 [Babylonia areolata]